MVHLTAVRWRSAMARLSALVTVALLVAGCAGGQTSRPPNAFTSWGAYLAASTDLGRLPARTDVSVTLSTREPDPAAAQAALSAMEDPSSPSYGQTLTPVQWEAAFGPPASAVARAQATAAQAGTQLSVPPGSTLGTLRGPAGAMSRLLQVAIDRWRGPDGKRFYSSRRAPFLPAALAAAFVAPTRLSDWTPPVHRDAPGRARAVPGNGLTPSDVENAYDIKPLQQQGLDGSGQTIVFWELGDGYSSSDLSTFDQHFGLPTPQITQVGPNQKQQGELIMDLETAHSLAPGARLVVYTANPQTEAGQDLLLQQMFQQQPGAVFDFSWGGCEQTWANPNFFVTGFQQAASLGDTVIASSGDSGGYECMQADARAPTRDAIGVSAPASSPDVLSVGGTRLSLNARGGYYDETPWNYAVANEGTGGGVSQAYSDPNFQQTAQHGRWSKRTVPDVSAIGDPETGLLNYSDGGWSQGGGTSLATPVWAAITALLNQYLKQQGQRPLGFYDAALYALAAGSPSHPPFHDIITGGNMVYNAGAGYDLASGLGSPDVWNLAQDLLTYEQSGGHG